MQLNTARSFAHVQTHEGAPASPHLTPMQQLRRSVLSCLLWEDEFYEDGASIGERIAEFSAKVPAEGLAALAIEARSEHNLRHVPLLLTAELAKRGGPVVSATLEKVIQRADEVAEFLTLYWRNGKTPIAKQVKKGLAKALVKFDAYQLAKYDREKAIRLRDVLFMVHAKPKDEAQAATWKQLVDGTLPSPDTWEVALSGGSDKRETFERLIREVTLAIWRCCGTFATWPMLALTRGWCVTQSSLARARIAFCRFATSRLRGRARGSSRQSTRRFPKPCLDWLLCRARRRFSWTFQAPWTTGCLESLT